MNAPLLSILLGIPFGGALLAWASPRIEWSRGVALLCGLAQLAMSGLIVARFSPGTPGFQMQERMLWIPGLGVHYDVGVDGLSILFLPAAALLFLGALCAGWRSVREHGRLYYSQLLILQGATVGCLIALDTILFFAFYEVALPAIFLLIGLWGHGEPQRRTATRYFMMMLAGGLPVLFAFVIAAGASGGAPVFDLPTLLTTPLPESTQYLVFVLLLIGFGVKMPLVPLHTWLPMLAEGAPVAVTALLVGIKLGVFGLLRFAVPLAPYAAWHLHWLLAGLGVVAVLYGAVTALVQSNLRGMLAYSSLSHVGLALLGLASFSIQGVQGAVLLLLGFPFITGGLFLLSGFLRSRTGSTDIASLGGVAKRMPLLASLFLFFGLAGLGIPGGMAFPAELGIFMAALRSHTGAALGALFGMVVGTAALLALYRAAFLGPVVRPAVDQARDLLPRELAVGLLFALVILAGGLFPGPLLELMRPAVEAWVFGVNWG